MFENDIVNLTYGDNLCRVEIIVDESEYVEGDTGHFTATATWTGGRRGSGNATFSETVRNPNGNLPALCLMFNDNSQGWASPSAYWGCGFNQAGASLVESNKSYNNWDATTIGGSTPPFLISPLFAGMSVWNLSLPNQDFQCTIHISADFPIFLCPYNTFTAPGFGFGKIHDQSDTTAETYAQEVMSGNYDNLDKAVNFVSNINEIPVNEVWTIHNYLKANGTITSSKSYSFRIKPDAKIYLVLHDKGLNGDGSANFILHITSSPWEQKTAEAPDDAYTETSTLDSQYWMGSWMDYNTGISYEGYGSTNIPIFDSDAKGQAYADGVIGIEDSINGGDTTIRTSSIGDPLNSSDIPSVNLAASGVGCNIYALSKSQILDLMSNYLYQTDPNVLQDVKDALWTWGNNPIDFFIDCYYIPFSLTSFYTLENAGVRFGSYLFTSGTFPVVKETNGDRKVLFNTTLEGMYGDWRDYTQFTYDLFLPFVGFITLDNYKYLNHQVKCEMMFDVTTHNVRYYLFVDGVLTDRIDGSVGINIPLMASDMVNKAKNDREVYRGRSALLSSTGVNIAAGIAGAATGNGLMVTGAVQNILGSVANYQQLADKAKQKAKESVYNSFSSAMNIYDINYAYIRITEDKTIIPSTLHSVYNYPSYYIGPLSALSGYCELSDIQLKTDCTEYEYNEIKNLLKEGVIF